MTKKQNDEPMRYPQFVIAVKDMGFDVDLDSEWVCVTKDNRFGMASVLGKVHRREQYTAWVSLSLDINEKQRRKLWFALCQFAATHPTDRSNNVILKAEVNGTDVYIKEYYRSTDSYVLTDRYVEADVFHKVDAGKISTRIMNKIGISFELEEV